MIHKTHDRLAVRISSAVFVLSILALIFLLSSCKRDDAVAPASSSTTVDDHGSGGHGADDPQ